MILSPLHLKNWIDENRASLKPPVGNRQIWEDRDFMVTVVAGPNQRRDYHINEGEEFFFQLEGDMVLKVLEKGKSKEIPIKEGEIFLLPPKVPHSPQRPSGTIGLVIEKKRAENEKDGLIWLCEKCEKPIYEEYFHLKDIVIQLKTILERYTDVPFRVCNSCGWKNQTTDAKSS